MDFVASTKGETQAHEDADTSGDTFDALGGRRVANDGGVRSNDRSLLLSAVYHRLLLAQHIGPHRQHLCHLRIEVLRPREFPFDLKVELLLHVVVDGLALASALGQLLQRLDQPGGPPFVARKIHCDLSIDACLEQDLWR